MNKYNKFYLLSAVSGSLLLTNDSLQPFRDSWAATQDTDTAEEIERRRLVGLIVSLTTLLSDGDENELAVDDNYTVNQNSMLTVPVAQGIFANDDNDNNVNVFTLLQDASNGTLTLDLSGNGAFEYLPNVNFTGIDTFRYSLTTINNVTDEALVTINVNGLPDAVDDAFILDGNIPFTGNVISNAVGGDDTIVDGAEVVAVTNAATVLGGTVTIEADGSFSYTPPLNLGMQQDSFTYTLQDSNGDTDTATIKWQVFFLNIVPTAQTVNEDVALEFNTSNSNAISVVDTVTTTELTVSDGVLSVTLASGASVIAGSNNSNTLKLSGTSNAINDTLATLTYQGSQDYNGIDILTMISTDASAAMDTDAIQITVTPVDDGSPVAADDAFTTLQDTPLNGNVLTNDTASFDEAAVDSVSAASTTLNGSITINADGEFTYTPPTGLSSGIDTFTYTLRDTDNETDTATITIGIGNPKIIIPNDDSVGANNDDLLVIENTPSAVAGSMTLIVPAIEGIGTLQIGNTTFSLAQLNSASLVAPLSIDGDINGQLQITGFNDVTGVLNYNYDPTAASQDHSGATNDIIAAESLAISLTDAATPAATATATLNIGITDTNPEANDDERAMLEGSLRIAGNAVGILGATGDIPDTLVDPNATPVTDIDFGTTDGTPGSNLPGDFGMINISNAGVYTYTLDDTSADVQGLKGGEHVVETFTYQITDGDGDTDTAELTVTINGVEDAPPTVSVVDRQVTEATGGIINGSATITASAGIAQLTLDGNDLTNIVSMTPATHVTVNASEGDLVITSFNTSTGVIQYNYTEDGNNEMHNAANDNIADAFTISVTDNEGESDSDILDILITDTAPTAAADNITVTENSFPGTGDVSINDTTGADTAISVVGVNFGGAQTVGTPFNSNYGTLDLNSDGTYTYTLDNLNSTVDNLNVGQSLTETFTYTITDTDGDTSAADLMVTINGIDD